VVIFIGGALKYTWDQWHEGEWLGVVFGLLAAVGLTYGLAHVLVMPASSPISMRATSTVGTTKSRISEQPSFQTTLTPPPPRTR